MLIQDAYDKLAQIARLKPGWDSYDAPAIGAHVVDRARSALWLAYGDGFMPSAVLAGRDGQVCIYAANGDLYGDVEFFSSGEIVAMTHRRGTAPTIWEVDAGSPTALCDAFRTIAHFVALTAPPPTRGGGAGEP